MLLAWAMIGACADDPTQPFESATLTIVTHPPEYLAVGDAIPLVLQLRDRRGQLLPTAAIDWTSDATGVAEVGPSGVVTAKGLGTATITATAGRFSATVQFSVAEPEWVVLYTLYKATGGGDWNRPWDLHAHYSEWHGVTVNGAGRVVGIVLDNNNLTGSIPPQLGSLTHLETLALKRNRLTGRIPPELGKLANLRELSLYRNQLVGSIPPELGDLAKLRRLYLSNNRLSGPIPRKLGSLTNLNELLLAGNDLSGRIPPELGNLENLWTLVLDGNRLSGQIPPEIGNLGQLVTLWLPFNELVGRLPQTIGNLGELEQLLLYENEFLRGPIPQSFMRLGKLEQFNFALTGLCVPQNDGFVEWLDEVDQRGRVITPPVQCEVLRTRRDVLRVFYHATGGDDWTDNTNWLTDAPLSDFRRLSAVIHTTAILPFWQTRPSRPMEWTPPPDGIAMCQDGTEAIG